MARDSICNDKDDKEAFLVAYSYYIKLDEKINAMLECYLNLSEIPNPGQSPLSLSVSAYTNNSSNTNSFWPHQQSIQNSV